ncbi:MAG TPA: CHAD domain-containing protein, partial [Pseudonocardiaceae bacterium]
MPDVVRETELKYEAPRGFTLPDLAGAGIAHVGEPAEHVLDATYFDTEDLRLAAAGITLRRRTGGTDAGWHAKLPVSPGVREEVRMPLGRGKARPPATLVALLRAHTGGAELTPVARIGTRRAERELCDPEGRPVVLISDDEVTAEVIGSGEAPDGWRELEAELAPDADPDALHRVDAALHEAGARPAGGPSKLARLLGDRVRRPDPPPAPHRGSSAGDVVLAYVRAQADAIRAHDTGVRLDRPDAVHQLRVACRRLRTALGVYKRVLDRDATRALSAELRWLGRVLAAARDAEVQHARLARELAALPEELVLGPVA